MYIEDLKQVKDLEENVSDDLSALEQSNAALAVVRCAQPSQFFQGRQEVLDKMHQYFSRDIGQRHTYVLYGLGGSGKTQIALKFLEVAENLQPPRWKALLYLAVA